MKKKKLLSTGEFAKLCKTTKETLFHYERENLLKPKYVSENGYRYYGVEQYFDFDLIAMFKETGSTLKEIQACFRDTDGKNFLSLLEEKRLAVKEERERLAQRELMLQDIVNCTLETLNFDYDTLVVQRQEEERLEVVPTAASLEDSIHEFVERLAEYANFYDKQGKFPRYPFGLILEQESVMQGQYCEKYFFSRATRSTPRSQLHIKPEGRYAVLLHKGTINTHLRICYELLQKIEGTGLTVAGNAYVYDMMSYMSQGSKEKYAAKYCIAVR